MATLLPPASNVAPTSLTVDGVLAHIKELSSRIHDNVPLVALVSRDEKVWMWDNSDDEDIIVNPRALAKLHERGYLPEEVKPLPTPRGSVVYMLKDEFKDVQKRMLPKSPAPGFFNPFSKYIGQPNTPWVRESIHRDMEDALRSRYPMMFVDPPYLMAGPEPTEETKAALRETLQMFSKMVLDKTALGSFKTANEFYLQQESKPDLPFWSEIRPVLKMYEPPEGEPTRITFTVLKNRDPGMAQSFHTNFGPHSMGAMVHDPSCVLCDLKVPKKP